MPVAGMLGSMAAAFSSRVSSLLAQSVAVRRDGDDRL